MQSGQLARGTSTCFLQTPMRICPLSLDQTALGLDPAEHSSPLRDLR